MTRFSLSDDPHGFVCDICKKKRLKNTVFNRSATVKLSEAGGVSKWYYDQKITSFFPSDFIRVFVSRLTGKILRLERYPNAAFFECKLGFHGPPLFTVKTDRLDFRGLDRG